MELLKESLDDMPAELNQQGELTAGLVMLLKKSIASEKKATGEIMRLQEDKAKLCHEIDLLKEKNAGWKKLHENSSSSMKMLQALVMEQKEELAKLHIEHPAAVKVRNAAVEQMMKARVEKIPRHGQNEEDGGGDVQGDRGRGGDEEAVTTPRRIRSFGVIIFLLLLLLCFIFCFGCFAARVTFSARHE